MHLPRDTSAKMREGRLRTGPLAAITASLLMLGGCANRPINPPIQQADGGSGYRFATALGTTLSSLSRTGSDCGILVLRSNNHVKQMTDGWT